MRKNVFFIILFLINSIIFSEELSEGYKDIKLGMSQDEVRDVLKKSFDFYTGREEAISIRLEPDTEIITAAGMGVIKIGYFHFNSDKLFQIFLKIDENKIGYYMLLKRFTNKFGKPAFLEPKRAYWENDGVRVIVEKPCSLKYQFLPIWNELIKNDSTNDSILNKYREKFVDDL